MAKVAAIQTNFNAGEISPLMDGRVDFDKYKTALKTCLNQIPLVQGPVTRRPGTVFVAEVKTSSAKTRLVRFEFSVTQAYVLEFGNGYVRIYRNHGRNESPPGTPVEVGGTAIPYTTADLFQLMFTQSADVLYIAHPNYPPASITRSSDTSWTYTVLTFTDGPYLDANTTATTLTLGATTTGSTSLVASAALFTATTDIGRPVRIQVPGQAWCWGVLTAVADTTHATITMMTASGSTTATAVWRLGLWSATTGWPACVTFYQERLCWGGCTVNPESVQLSVTGNYLSHQPTAYDTAGTVVDSHALNITLSSNDVQNVRWMSGDANGLLIGTVSGEWALAPSTLGGALTPTNLNAVQMTAYGSAQIRAVRVGYTTLMVQRSKRKVREITFVYYENRYHAPDMTALAPHISLGGITDVAYQQEPNSILWSVRADGMLLGFTYERDQNVVGWHRHQLGGSGVVESVATIPAPDGLRDELWMIVKRTINGSTKRYVEYMTKTWEDGDDKATAVYADSALQYAGSPVATVTGATHLIGATVGVLADGSSHPDVVVDNSGHIALNRPASNVTIGLRYNSDGETLRNDAGAANGTAQGKTQRTNRVNFRVYETLGLKAGPDFDSLVERVVRTTADPAGAAVPLFTGDDTDTWEGDYTMENLVCWRFDGMFPGTLLAIMPQLSTQDR